MLPMTCAGTAPQGIRVITAGAPPAAATIQRMEGELGWNVTQVYGLTETAPFITVCEPRPEHASLPLDQRCIIKARQGVELVTSGDLRVLDEAGNEVPHDGNTLERFVSAATSSWRVLQRSEGDGGSDARRLVSLR
jgi:fatty-acyl-CoA synthase